MAVHTGPQHIESSLRIHCFLPSRKLRALLRLALARKFKYSILYMRTAGLSILLASSAILSALWHDKFPIRRRRQLPVPRRRRVAQYAYIRP